MVLTGRWGEGGGRGKDGRVGGGRKERREKSDKCSRQRSRYNVPSHKISPIPAVQTPKGRE